MRQFFLLLLIFCSTQSFSQKQGQALVDSLLTEIPKAGTDTAKTKLYITLSDLYIDIDQKKSLLYADSAYYLAVKSKWNLGIGNSQLCYGNIFNFTGDFKRAIDSLNKSVEIFKKIENKKYLGLSTYTLGSSYARMGDYTTATDYYSKALKIHEVIPNNDRLTGFCFAGLASMFYMQKDYAKSLDYSFKALDKKKKSKNKIAIANQLKDIGDTYYEMKDSAQAEKYNLEALALYTETGNKFGKAEVYSHLGKVYGKNTSKSLSYFIQSREMYKELNADSYYTILRDGQIAQVLLLLIKKSDYETAHKVSSEFGTSKAALLDVSEKNLKDVVQLCITENDKENEYQYRQSLAEVQYLKGNYRQAYENHVGFFTQYDSIYSQENKNKVASIENQKAIDLKNKEIQLSEVLLSAQKKQKLGLIAGLLLLTTIGGLLFWQSRSRKKTNTTLMVLNNQLDEANKVKAKFFGILSHDLRSPVANLINFLQLQKRNPGILNEQQITDKEKKITDSAQSLLETMEGMLLWSKGQMENFKPEIKSVAVNDLFSYLEKFFATTENVQFTFNNPQNVLVNTDENYLQTIMHNLTANAIKALKNTPNATILWNVVQEQDKISLSITDNGPGLDTEQSKALYEDAIITSSKTGLGLHIIRDLAKAIQCKISVQSKSGFGTTFTLAV